MAYLVALARQSLGCHADPVRYRLAVHGLRVGGPGGVTEDEYLAPAYGPEPVRESERDLAPRARRIDGVDAQLLAVLGQGGAEVGLGETSGQRARTGDPQRVRPGRALIELLRVIGGCQVQPSRPRHDGAGAEAVRQVRSDQDLDEIAVAMDQILIARACERVAQGLQHPACEPEMAVGRVPLGDRDAHVPAPGVT